MNRKKQQQVEDIPVDKMDQFLAANYKKLLGGVVVLLIGFLAIYAFTSMSKSKAEMMTNKAGQLELIMTMSGGDQQKLDDYLAMANEYTDIADYVYLKSAEILVSGDNMEAAKSPLSMTGGDLTELADGLRFDTGLGSVAPENYIKTGKMTALWYYRACLSAEGDQKAKLMAEFKEKYPENVLYKQIERWNG